MTLFCMLRGGHAYCALPRVACQDAGATAKGGSVYRLMARVLIVLGLVLATSMPGFARMAPMAMGQTTSAPCTGLDCAGHHNPGRSSNHHMTSLCLTMACTGPVSLLPYKAIAIPVLHGAALYEPPVLVLHAGLRPMPDGPPPRSLALS